MQLFVNELVSSRDEISDIAINVGSPCDGSEKTDE